MLNSIQVKAADAFVACHGYSAAVVRIRNTAAVSIDYRVGGAISALAAGTSVVIDTASSTSEVELRRTDLSATPANVLVDFGITPEESYELSTAAAAAAVAGLGVKGGTFYAADYGVISATEPVSHLAIQAAIDAAAVLGGTVVLPPQKMLIGASLVPKSGVTVTGTQPGVTPNSGNYDLGFTITSGSILSYPGGIIFNEDDSGAYSSTDYLSRFNLHGIGFQDCTTILRSGGRSRRGLSGSSLRDLFGAGITDWAFAIANGQHVQADNIMVCAVGGVHLWVDSRDADEGAGKSTSPGNSSWKDFYVYQPQAGAIHEGILIEVKTGSDGMLGGIAFWRPQVNRFNTTATDKYAIRAEGYAGHPHPSLSFHDIDLEGCAAGGMYINYVTRFYASVGGVTTNPDEMPWTFVVGNSSGVVLSSPHPQSKVKFLDGGTAAVTYCSGDWTQAGEANVRPLGVYRDRSRGAGSMIYQWDTQDVACSISSGDKANYGATELNLSEGGKLKLPTADYTAGGNGWHQNASAMVLVNTAGYTMPPASECTGCTLVVKKTGNDGACTISRAGENLIDGATSFSLTTQYASRSLRSDGYNWYMVAAYLT